MRLGEASAGKNNSFSTSCPNIPNNLIKISKINAVLNNNNNNNNNINTHGELTCNSFHETSSLSSTEPRYPLINIIYPADLYLPNYFLTGDLSQIKSFSQLSILISLRRTLANLSTCVQPLIICYFPRPPINYYKNCRCTQKCHETLCTASGQKKAIMPRIILLHLYPDAKHTKPINDTILDHVSIMRSHQLYNLGQAQTQSVRLAERGVNSRYRQIGSPLLMSKNMVSKPGQTLIS